MATVTFTQNLQRYLTVPQAEVMGKTVAEALEEVFRQNSQLKGYLLDDQGRLRQHVVVFVDGIMIEDRNSMTDKIGPTSELFVAQALSGG
jgi:molybdopterin synthase sulfur carrier subunit